MTANILSSSPAMNAFQAALLALLISVVSASHIGLTLGVRSSSTYRTKCGEYTYFEVTAVSACKDLQIIVSPSSGEPDIYVSHYLGVDEFPSAEKLTWAAFADGDYNLTISHWDTESSPGEYYIGITNDCSMQSDDAVYSVFVSEVTNDEEDLFLSPDLGINKLVVAEGYSYYKFCLPQCADVKISLDNCMSNTQCPGTYSYPELLVSRTAEEPTIYSHSYKLASVVRRHVQINHTDPSGRDDNGYAPGTYYVGVYGWCTPDNYVTNYATDGPCSYAAQTRYNVTINTNPHAESECSAELEYESYDDAVAKYPTLTSGQARTGIAPCNGTYVTSYYSYYKVALTSPCDSVNIKLSNRDLNDFSNVPELAVGVWPNTKPTFDNLEWTSYDWGSQDLTISAYDPALQGGRHCGPTGGELCYLYVGVVAYCTNLTIAKSNPTPWGKPGINFTLTATLSRASNIYNAAQKDQMVTPKGATSYAFCVDDETEDTVADLQSFTDACACPNSYTSLQMVVSKIKPSAAIDDLVWRATDGSASRRITLDGSSNSTRAGTYYLNVIGACTRDWECTDNCTCAPCSHVGKEKYSLYVGTDNSSIGGAVGDYLGTCQRGGSGSLSCSQLCASSIEGGLSAGEIAGIVVAVVVFVSVVSAVAYLVYRKFFVYWRLSSGPGGGVEMDKLTVYDSSTSTERV